MKTKRIIIAGLFTLLPHFIYSQIDKGLSYEVEAGATASGGEYAPFWLTANKHGLSSIEKNYAYLRAGIYRPYEEDKRFTYGFGLEMAGLHNFTSRYVVQQAYVDLRYRAWELSIGAKERGSELKNDALSTGGMTFSSNARPIPQARISLPEYIPFPGTRQWLHIRGHIAYGYYTDDRFKKNFTQGRSKYDQHALYHSKAVFMKLEHEKFPVIIEAGMEMGAQFGGKCYYPDGSVIDTPNGFWDFFRILVPMRGGDGASESDQINILGNQLGSYHLSVTYPVADWKFRGYYEHYFEDGSGMVMKYGMWRDCLAGLEVTFPKNPFISSLVGEFLYTKNQSGAFHYFALEVPRVGSDSFTGADNYYNNGQFAGWEHWGQGYGNPLLVSPIYNKDNSLDFQANRVKAYHVGISSNPTSELNCRLLMTFAKHWGTYASPFREIRKNNNALLEVTYSPEKWKGWHFTLAGALDRGDMIGENNGGMLTIRKEGLFGGKKK